MSFWASEAEVHQEEGLRQRGKRQRRGEDQVSRCAGPKKKFIVLIFGGEFAWKKEELYRGLMKCDCLKHKSMREKATGTSGGGVGLLQKGEIVRSDGGPTTRITRGKTKGREKEGGFQKKGSPTARCL